ncbi:MAG: site-2 protease family protein [Pirellulales bacterium]
MTTDESAEREPLDPLGALGGGKTIQSIDDLIDLDLPRRPPLPRLRPGHAVRERRVVLPVVLFLITCLSTFWAGATNWQPAYFFSYGSGTAGSLAMMVRISIVHNWQQGLAYMVSLLVILFSHEMGHFIATVLYRIPASLPFFIPFPITPIGTMGAVIAMDGFRANRREIFDIGLAGPVAGLVLAIPILCYGILHLASPAEAFEAAGAIGTERYDLPLIVEWLVGILRPDLGGISSVTTGQLNPWFMAGWVGLLITGVNMMPVSQLDGGHVIYGLFGTAGHWIARGFVFVAITYVVFARVHIWTVMLILVILMGVDHPPTADDRVPLGPWRTLIGILSLSIPILCFPIRGLESLSLG